MQKKKVLFVATVVKTHMMQFHIPYLKMFQEMGWETAVASKNDYENPADCQIPYCDTYYDIPFERLPWKPRNIQSYKMLKKIIDEGNYDIIHCHTPVGAMIARLAALSARKKGTKVIYTAHGFHFFKGAPLLNWLLFYPAEWLLAPVTDVLITINQEDHARALKQLHAKRIEYVPGVGIHTEKFRELTIDRTEKRRSLGYGEEDFLALTVAEMTPNKNHITALKAIEKLKGTREYEKLHYLIVGRGEMWSSLEESAKELGISDHVHFLGYRRDVVDICAQADVFAFPTRREGLGLAPLEAMYCGLPVIASDTRGIQDYTFNGKSGYLRDSEDAVGFAEAIVALKSDAAMRRRFGEFNRETVKDFCLERVKYEVLTQLRNCVR